jgi:hypothetical protein
MRLAFSGSHARTTAVPASSSPAGLFMARCGAALRAWLSPEARCKPGEPARIRQFDVFEQPKEWARCREAGWYHLSRARRAIDRESRDEAERHAREARRWDDTRAANNLALGEVLARRSPPDLDGARCALEAAFNLEPSNGYIVDRLRAAYAACEDRGAAIRMLRRALAAGAPEQVWGPELASLESVLVIPLAS